MKNHRNRHLIPLAALAVACALGVTLSGCRSGATNHRELHSTDQRASEAAFLDTLRAMCGRRYPGRTEFMASPEEPLLSSPLVMHIRDCGELEMRIPFIAGEDRSRTWVLTVTDRGLLLKHDHRHEDGTPDELTNYGGYALPGGTATRQRFRADAFTAELIPAAVTNVWTMEVDHDARTFTYALERHEAPRFRAVFDMSRPLPQR